MPVSDNKTLKITLVKSGICCPEKHKRIITALGLRKRGRSYVRVDRPEVRGMLDEISYLVRWEQCSGDEAAPSSRTRTQRSA